MAQRNLRHSDENLRLCLSLASVLAYGGLDHFWTYMVLKNPVYLNVRILRAFWAASLAKPRQVTAS